LRYQWTVAERQVDADYAAIAINQAVRKTIYAIRERPWRWRWGRRPHIHARIV
jgi:hypothetical protein